MRGERVEKMEMNKVESEGIARTDDKKEKKKAATEVVGKSAIEIRV